ncbi:MAG: DinB family protein, partial [Anaerolineae bacterium]|nr:DinB family protein [Anaerolineae bacterium]
QMTQNAERIRALVEGVSDTQARWKPDPEAWSILEVVNHLYDEEREDFRARLDHVLHRPDQTWPGIDPQGWVTARRYNERELDSSLDQFLSEREKSIAWLHTLPDPDWQASYEAPWGSITAGDVMASWIAHDLLHMRQLVKLHFLFVTAELAPHNTRYAGTW